MNRIVHVDVMKVTTKYKLRSEKVGDAFGTGCDDEGLFPTYSVQSLMCLMAKKAEFYF